MFLSVKDQYAAPFFSQLGLEGDNVDIGELEDQVYVRLTMPGLNVHITTFFNGAVALSPIDSEKGVLAVTVIDKNGTLTEYSHAFNEAGSEDNVMTQEQQLLAESIQKLAKAVYQLALPHLNPLAA